MGTESGCEHEGGGIAMLSSDRLGGPEIQPKEHKARRASTPAPRTPRTSRETYTGR